MEKSIYQEFKEISQAHSLDLLNEYNEGEKIAKKWFDEINKIIPCENYTFTRKVKKQWDCSNQLQKQ